MVLETLDVPAEQGRESDPLHETVEVHLGARLVAVATGDDHPGTIRMPLEDRPQRAIELGIDQDHVLAMLDRVQSHLCSELHGSGRLNQGVDAIGPTQDCRIVGDRELPAGDRVLQLGAGGDPPHRLDAGAGIRGLGCLDVTVRYGHQLHPLDRADDLLGQGVTQSAGPDHADPDRIPGRFPSRKRPVNDDHRGAPTADRSGGQARSFKETSTVGSGHRFPRIGSSYRTPRSHSGA